MSRKWLRYGYTVSKLVREGNRVSTCNTGDMLFYHCMLSWYMWTKYNLTVIEKNNAVHAKQFGPIPMSIWSQSEKHIPDWKENLSQRSQTRFSREISAGRLQRCGLGKGHKNEEKTRNQQFVPSPCPGCCWNDVLLSSNGALLVISAITLS